MATSLKVFLFIALVLISSVGGYEIAVVRQAHKTNQANVTKTAPPAPTNPAATTQDTLLQAGSSPPVQSADTVALDSAKNYGNKYANGILPVGDNRYSTTGAKKGYVYLCQANFAPAGQAGAQTRGPWFINNNTEWDSNKKVSVQGTVNWKPSISNIIQDAKRIITTNDLPNHHTGVFPVQSSDPAHAYDSNPNSISSQSLTYNLNAQPTVGQPNCMGGEAGVMLTGAALFNAFDAGGRDAGAWEVQDGCDGHPQNKGEYHYHTLSKCIKDVGVGTVIGFALDGFPITGPKISDANILTTADLDDCHGLMSEITLDGKKVTMYHYVMTQDFPYSVSCFRSQAIQPPGQHESFSQGQTGTALGARQSSPPPNLAGTATKNPPPPPVQY